MLLTSKVVKSTQKVTWFEESQSLAHTVAKLSSWGSFFWGQFHQRAYAQLLLHQQIPKAQKDSQVIITIKVDQLVELLYFDRFVLYTVCSSLIKLTPGSPKIPFFLSFVRCFFSLEGKSRYIFYCCTITLLPCPHKHSTPRVFLLLHVLVYTCSSIFWQLIVFPLWLHFVSSL